MFLEFRNPIPVIIKETKQEGYALYVKDGEQWNNDCWCVVLKEGGGILHVLSNQILVHSNDTYRIQKSPTEAGDLDQLNLK